MRLLNRVKEAMRHKVPRAYDRLSHEGTLDVFASEMAETIASKVVTNVMAQRQAERWDSLGPLECAARMQHADVIQTDLALIEAFDLRAFAVAVPLENCYFVADDRGADGLPAGAHVCSLYGGASGHMGRSGFPLDDDHKIEAQKLAGKYWRMDWTSIMSTEEVFAPGCEDKRVSDGPFNTRDAAEYAMDLLWESYDSD
jgi:hypothetical protein